MPDCPIDLNSLLVSTLFMTPGRMRDLAQSLYEEHYVKVGSHATHDGQPVIFFRDRFEHAFFRSFNFVAAKGRKNEIDQQRVERIMWIGELIKGAIPQSECLRIPNERAGRPCNRLYIIKSECYVVWLEPLKSGGWRFSSAYKPLAHQIKGYRKSGTLIWKHGQK